MNKNKPTKPSDYSKSGKPAKNSTGRMRFFYILMLGLIILSMLIQVTGASRRSRPGPETPTSQASHVEQERMDPREIEQVYPFLA